MGNPSKAKGTRAETAVVRYMLDHGIEAERRALTGSSDSGDVKLTDDMGRQWVIEIKAGKQTSNPNRTQLEEWLRQTRREGRNANMPCALCVVRYRRALEDADVYILRCNVLEYMHLDEFARSLKV